MRDAESMLDQLLSAAPDRIDESHVRDLLGLADAEVVEAFIDHLVRGDGAAGVALLDSLEERGRDIRALLDQAVEAIRAELIAGLSDPASARHDPAALAAAGRRLAAIDPNRAGIGGLRFQLELAMFAAAPTSAAAPVSSAGARSDAFRRRHRHRRPPRLHRRPPRLQPLRPSSPSASSTQRRTPTPDAGPAPDSASAPTRSTTPAQPPPRRRRPAVTSRPRRRSEQPPSVAVHDRAASDGSLDQLLAAWPAIVEQLSSHPPTKPLIVACRPVAVDGAIVTLGFPEEQAFLKDQAERRKPGIEAGIAAVIGHPVTVRCVVANVELAAGRVGRSRRRGAPDLRRGAGRRRRGQLTREPRPRRTAGARRLRQTDRRDSDERRQRMGMANLQKMAQQMQQEMLRIQTELESTLIDGSAGGGVVRATVTGKQELVSITIDPSAVDPDDVEMLQDLVLAAVNEALRSSRELAEEKMSAVTGGLRLPGM